MADFDMETYLLALAQISVTLVGFAALVAVLGEPKDHVESEYHKVRLLVVVLLPLLTMVFSLLPFPLAWLGVDEPLMWRILSGILLLVAGTNFFILTRRNKRASGDFSIDEPIHYAASILLSSAVLLALGANAMGIIPEREAAVYASVLTVLTTESAHVFWISFRIRLGRSRK